MTKERIVVFTYSGHLAYATESEWGSKSHYMYCKIPFCSNFEEAKDYLETVCNYDNEIVDMTDFTTED